MAEILLAEDDAAIRLVVTQALNRAGHTVRSTSNGATLWKWVQGGEGDLVLSDVMMPDQSAFDLLPKIRNARADLPVVLMSARNTFMTAVRASELGAYEYIPKPFDLRDLLDTIGRALASRQNRKTPRGAPEEELPIVGRSPAMQDVYRTLARVMQTDLPVLITGESGTGKEIVARAFHDYGRRRTGPFVTFNPSSVPADRVNGELFGVAGAGEGGSSAGRFEEADGGTLFLDEVGDMPMDVQTRLVQVLKDGNVHPSSGSKPRHVDVQVIASSYRPLTQLIERGRFREDLYYRLNVVPVRLPPLRERAQDIPDLVRHFFSHGARDGLSVKVFEPQAMERLQAHHWPGNVRELENLVRRLSALHPSETITLVDLEAELAEPGDAAGVEPVRRTPKDPVAMLSEWTEGMFANGEPPRPGLYHRVLEDVERPLIRAALAATRGNQIRAAEILGLNRNTLRKKIRDLDIEVTRVLR